jgi:hypothetical protein
MSRPAKGNAASSLSSRQGEFSRAFTNRQMRSIRKELLMTRAAIERMEIAEAGQELRQSVANFSWLRLLVPRWSSPGFGKMGRVLRDHPLASSVASLILSAAPRIKLLRKAFKWGAVGLTAWETWQVWQQYKPKDRSRDSRGRK